MRIIKKLAALAVCFAVGITALTGCSDSDGSSSNSQTSEAAGDNSQSELTIADISSAELVQDMKIGWNLGNSLDVCNADRDGDGVIDENSDNVDETLWGNVTTTPEIFETLKSEGFNAVRIPVTWRDHMSDDYTVDADWMDRVQEVVDYAIDQDMYVIINVHHDGGGDPDFGAWIRSASTDKDTVMEKYKTLWTQIAERFKDYDEKLLFESMNEVGFDDLSNNEAYALLNEFNQTFVDLVRDSGGNNSERHLVIAGYWTDVDKTCNELFKMPEDSAGKCILSVHYYTPWEFCTTNIQETWGTESEVELMESKVEELVETYVNNGVPVIIGEFGTGVWNEEASGIYFSEMLVKLCHDAGITTFMWDDGAQFNREALEWNYPNLVTAMMKAVSGEDYEVTKTAA